MYTLQPPNLPAWVRITPFAFGFWNFDISDEVGTDSSSRAVTCDTGRQRSKAKSDGVRPEQEPSR